MSHEQPQLPGMPPSGFLIRVKPRVIGGVFRVQWWPEPDRFDIDVDQLEHVGVRTVTYDELPSCMDMLGRHIAQSFGRAPARLS